MSQSRASVLVVDDERPMQRLLRTCLQLENYQVFSAYTCKEAIAAAVRQSPDLILLDILLPDGNGLDVLRELRGWSQVPIIVLSVQDNEREKVRCLDAGANDFITKPFSAGELGARIRVALRHRSGAVDAIFRSGPLTVDFARRLVLRKGVPVRLTRLEYNLLRFLAVHAGKVLTQNQIMKAVWPAGKETETNLLRVYIANLRKKIEEKTDNPQLIVTEPAVGYRLNILDPTEIT